MTELKTLGEIYEGMDEKWVQKRNVVSEWIKHFFGITEEDLQEKK